MTIHTVPPSRIALGYLAIVTAMAVTIMLIGDLDQFGWTLIGAIFIAMVAGDVLRHTWRRRRSTSPSGIGD